MSEDDFGAGRDMSSLAPGKHRGPRFSWNSAFEAIFFKSLCDSVQLGLREGTIFKPEAWERAAQALNEQGAFPNKNHLINKSDNARKKFRLWRGLREDPEFYYDENSKTVTATEDTWRRHIEVRCCFFPGFFSGCFLSGYFFSGCFCSGCFFSGCCFLCCCHLCSRLTQTQKEPLSKSLKGRPFEHEEYYEVLFPDVVGSRGAPKRITKPRRKTDSINEPDSQNNSMMDLLADVTFDPLNTSPQVPQQALQQQPIQPQRTLPMQHPPQPVSVQPRPSLAQMPTAQSIASSSALTPPEENPSHPRKRQHQCPFA
jgi:hypothetical protein